MSRSLSDCHRLASFGWAKRLWEVELMWQMELTTRIMGVERLQVMELIQQIELTTRIMGIERLDPR